MKPEWEKNRREMRWRNLNCGLKEGVFCRQHRCAMGPAIFLFGRLVAWQTKPNGLVWGGHPFTYREIAHYMDESPRTVENWMTRLQKRGRTGGPYIRIKRTSYSHMIIYILNPKKFRSSQQSLCFSDAIRLEKSPQVPQLLRTSSPADQRDRAKGLRDSSIEQKGKYRGTKKPKTRRAESEPGVIEGCPEQRKAMAKLRELAGKTAVPPICVSSDAELEDRRQLLQAQAELLLQSTEDERRQKWEACA